MPKYKREKIYDLTNRKVNVLEDVKDNNFQPLINKIIESNKSYFITGAAGTGKSTMINDLKEELTKNNKKYKCLCPTNLSALIIGGSTLHKFITKIKKMESIYNMSYDYIFVDEISMVKECFYKFLLTIKSIKKNIKFIISGDFNQLPPINDRAEYNYKDSIALKELTDYNMLHLETCRRADDKLNNICKFENIMNININDFGKSFAEKHLCFTNEKRIEVNKQCMNRYIYKYPEEKLEENKKKKKYIIIEKNKHNSQSQEILLYKGLPLICKITDEKSTLNNNEQFMVKRFNENETIIKSTIDERELTIDNKEINKIFYPAYCITIHASQGCTIKESYTIHQFYQLDKHLRYVALSRSTKFENINIFKD
jgi:ATP-dependent exoDNAse (exonuclease V) alpha subunit